LPDKVINAGIQQIMNNATIALCGALCSTTALAQSSAEERENPNSSIPYESGSDTIAARQDRWSDFLPIWGAQAREQGYVLPRPFGVSLGYMGQKQTFDVDGLEVEGLDLIGSGAATLDEIDNQEDTITLRFDVWILPFFNVYGILGKTEGEADGVLTLNTNLIPPRDLAFDINYKGDVVGGGITIAGGYKDFFGMIDSNYTETDLDISSTDAEATVTSARLGWNGKLGGFTGALWLGAMHQDISQTLDLKVPTPVGLVNIFGPQIDVAVEQSTQSPWNTVLGGRWEINRSFEMLVEFGVGDRRSNMLVATYRF
jgi:hypothetical protein